jgi:Secretion system C-terminal sorting domain
VGGYGTATGNFMLKVTSPDCFFKPAVDCGKEVEKTDLTAISKEKAPFKVSTAPNPSTNHVDFQVRVSQPGTAQLRIMDLTGQVVAVRDLGELEAGQHTVRHDWQGVAAGVYLYEFRVGDAQQTGKLQVLR